MTVNEGTVQPAVRPAARGAVCLIYVIAAAKSRHHPAPLQILYAGGGVKEFEQPRYDREILNNRGRRTGSYPAF